MCAAVVRLLEKSGMAQPVRGVANIPGERFFQVIDDSMIGIPRTVETFEFGPGSRK
ncbi:hypothetical protein ABH944_004518 [Caballeronia udeis]|jgi:hypothetical protein|uniref:Uncharacterized protein n=1 Tax=Caballeronia udeis TaxID=1232866 RepID=A0ABW8MMB3_9BURK